MDSRPGEGTDDSPGWRPQRVALVFGLLTGILGVVLAINDFSGSVTQLDYHAYYFTGQAILDGEHFVGAAIQDGNFLTRKEYVYPPITGPIFVLYGIFPTWHWGYVINVGLLLAIFYLVGRLVIQFIEDNGNSLERVDRLLILGFCLFSGHSILGLYRGNIDPIILFALAVGLLAIQRGDEYLGGTLWGVAALFKLFPAFLGVWLIHRRAYRAIVAATGIGLGFMALGLAVFGLDTHVEFFEFILNERSRKGAFVGGLDPELQWVTLRRPLSQFLPLSGNQLMIVSAAIVVPFVYLVYREIDSELDRIVAFFATMVALLITVVPSTANYVVYLYFPLLGLIYLTDDERTRNLFILGLVLVNIPLYPQHVELVVDALPLASGVGDAIVGGARTVMRYSSVLLVGFLVLLAGCIRFVRVSASEHGEVSGT